MKLSKKDALFLTKALHCHVHSNERKEDDDFCEALEDIVERLDKFITGDEMEFEDDEGEDDYEEEEEDPSGEEDEEDERKTEESQEEDDEEDYDDVVFANDLHALKSVKVRQLPERLNSSTEFLEFEWEGDDDTVNVLLSGSVALTDVTYIQRISNRLKVKTPDGWTEFGCDNRFPVEWSRLLPVGMLLKIKGED